MEAYSAYGHAILSVSIYAVIALVLSALTGIRKGSKDMAPGAFYAADYNDPSYRLDRAFMNCAETLPAFAAIVAMAILAGASPMVVNWMASIVLVLRLVYTFAYLKKLGAGYGGLRTMLTVLSTLGMLIIFIVTLGAVF